jgi:hypothetical protein
MAGRREFPVPIITRHLMMKVKSDMVSFLWNGKSEGRWIGKREKKGKRGKRNAKLKETLVIRHRQIGN